MIEKLKMFYKNVKIQYLTVKHIHFSTAGKIYSKHQLKINKRISNTWDLEKNLRTLRKKSFQLR